MALQHLRSSTANKRPLPAGMSDGQLAINTNLASPGVFFKDSNGDLVKAGPVHVGSTAPNASPAAGGQTGNTKGELWLDTSLTPNELKTWDGSAWVSATGQEIPVSKLIDGSARQLLQTDAAGTGVEWTSNIDVPGTLDVTSTATFDSIAQHPLGSAGAPTITFTGDTNTGIYSPGADQVAVATSGAGRLFIDSSGNVGVGAASPSFVSGYAGLQVNTGSNGSVVKLTNSFTGTTSTDGFDIILQQGGSEAYIWQRESAPLIFGTAATERLRVTAAGLVGVGTSSPSRPLHVVGSAVFDDGTTQATVWPNLGSNDAGFGTNTNHAVSIVTNGSRRINVTAAGLVGIGTSLPQQLLQVGGFSGSNGITVGAGSSNYSVIYLADGTAGTEAYRGYLQYNHATDKLELGSAAITAVTIDSSQRVGIGTTSPSELLHVNGNAIVEDRLLLQRLQSSDNLSVLTFADTLTGSKGNNLSIGNPGGYDVLFHTGGVEKARIDSSGRLLVGTSSARVVYDNTPSIQLEGTDYDKGSLSIVNNQNTFNGADLILGKSRGTSIGSNTIVQADDSLGRITWVGADGTDIRTPAAQISAQVDGTPGANDMPGRIVLSTTASGASSPTERMRLDNNGELDNFSSGSYIYKARSSSAAGTSAYLYWGGHSATNTGNGTASYYVTTNGNVSNTNNSYGAISDIKLKENIVDANSQWDDLKALQVRKYNFKEGQTHTQIGLVAQEVELVSPGLVTESPDRDEDGNDLGTVTKSVNYSVLYMKAVKALQEAMERIETLEASNTDLLARVSALESA